jgi:hypothetical protein
MYGRAAVLRAVCVLGQHDATDVRGITSWTASHLDVDLQSLGADPLTVAQLLLDAGIFPFPQGAMTLRDLLRLLESADGAEDLANP